MMIHDRTTRPRPSRERIGAATALSQDSGAETLSGALDGETDSLLPTDGDGSVAAMTTAGCLGPMVGALTREVQMLEEQLFADLPIPTNEVRR